VQVDDADVERHLLQFTLLSVEEIEELMVAHRELPEGRRAQRVLASTMTALVHGDEAARAADAAAEVLFGGDPTSAPLEALQVVAREVPTTYVDRTQVEGLDLVTVLVQAGLASSNGEARRLLGQGGIAVNGRKVSGADTLHASDLLHGFAILLRKGKSTYHLLVAEKA
jgi:tyrosyl-tRNA synthetase